jgi:biotin carboxyl carrier protein
MKYTALVNDKVFEVEKLPDGLSWRIQDQTCTPDVIQIKENRFHAIVNQKNFCIEVLEFRQEEKTLVLLLNGSVYQVRLKDSYDELLHRLGMDSVSHHKANDLRAPMPGLVVKVMVEEGQVVKQGTPLLVLEAMKMENVLKATGDGIIAAIQVKAGQAVEKNETLIQFK